MSFVTVNKTEIESYDVDWPGLAKAVEARVMQQMQESLETWKDDVSMKAMALKDAADGLDVCVLIAEGSSGYEIENRLWEMDTAARDVVYEMIEAETFEDFLSSV